MKKTSRLLLKNIPLFLILPFLQAQELNAQTGVIKGQVIDSLLQEGALVDVEAVGPLKQVTMSDADGSFIITNLLEGNYKVVVTGDDYQSRTYENIQVKNGDTVALTLYITAPVAVKEKMAGVLDEVKFSSAKNTNTVDALIEETRLSSQVANGISQEQIKNSQDKNAAQVMSRIPGITVVDGRFVMVRGIPERYNQVLLNNSIAPSTEVDKRTFSFDLIPSNVLDRMLIYKSGAPENTGDFAGGLIKVYTANANEDHLTSVNLSFGYRTGTTGSDYIQSKGSGTDALGFDNGYRQMPAAFPVENLRTLPNRSQKRVDAAKTLQNNFAPATHTAMPDVSAGFNLARRFFIKGVQVNTINAINYSQAFLTYDKSFSRYLELGAGQPEATKRFRYSDNYNEKENKIGVISNWSFRFNSRNKLEFRNLFNQIGENITVIRNGEDYIQQVGLDRRNYLYQYRSRSIYSGQLEGTHDHKMANKTAKLNWVLGMNYLFEDQPDLRRFRMIETAEGSGEMRMILPPSSNLYDAGRFFSKLNETGFNHSLNYILDLNDNPRPVQLKLGYMLDYRMRNFDTRYFSYIYPGSSSLEVLQQLERQSLDRIFSGDNMKTTDGFLMEEGTRASDSYTASNFLTAGYAGLVLPLGRLTLSGGVRVEYNVLKLNTSNDAGGEINVNNPVLSPLGFLNSDYNLTEKTKLRFAYYRAVNRPEFRELAPFLFYDYQFDAEKYGNPDLKTANIDNFDLRYEIYPRKGEAISIGAFYKHFTNPIETLILIRSESPAFSYQNAASSYSRGLELEFRKSFEGMTRSGFVDKLSANVNAAYIQSQVDYGENVVTGQETKRALQGQSPYIINATLSYNDKKSGLQVNTSYNIFGKRIFAVGSALFPTIYEMPRHALDLTVSKSFGNNWGIKLGIQDLLNYESRFYQDTDRDGTINMKGMDDAIFKFRRGTLYSLSLSYKF